MRGDAARQWQSVQSLFRICFDVCGEVLAKHQLYREQAGGPCDKDGGRLGLSFSGNYFFQNRTTYGGQNLGSIGVGFEEQSSGLSHEVARRDIEFPILQEGLETILVSRQLHDWRKATGASCNRCDA